MAERLLYRVEETAEMLGVCRAKVFNLIRDGHLDSVKVGGSRRVPAAAIERYVAGLVAAQTAA